MWHLARGRPPRTSDGHLILGPGLFIEWRAPGRLGDYGEGALAHARVCALVAAVTLSLRVRVVSAASLWIGPTKFTLPGFLQLFHFHVNICVSV